MEPRGRIDVGPLIAIPGALLLLVSLFLDWYEPGLEAWKVFEVLDLVLAAIALACLLAAAERLGTAVPGGRAASRALPALGVVALVIVVSQAINHPPAAVDQDADTGLWLALAGAALLAVGAVLSSTRISLAVNVEGRGPSRGAEPETAPLPESGPGGARTSPRSSEPLLGKERADPAPAQPPPAEEPR